MANENINFKVGADTKSAEKNAERLEKSFEQTADAVKDVNKELDKTGSKGKGLGKVFSGMKFGAGLAAGKGLMDKLLGSLIENEKVANLFNDALSIISGTAEGLAEILEPAFDAIGNAIKNPKKAWDDLVAAFERGQIWIYDNIIKGVGYALVEQWNNLKISILGLQKAWNDFTGDQEESAEIQGEINKLQQENIEISKDQAKRVENIKGAVKGATDTLVKWGGIIAKNVEKTFKGNQALRGTTNAYIVLNAKIEENIKTIERQMSVNETMAGNERLTFEERRKAIQANLQLAKDRIEQEKQLLKNAQTLLALESQAKGKSAERTAQYKALQVQIDNLGGSLIETENQIGDTLRTIDEQQTESAKAVADAIAEQNQAVAEANSQIGGLEHERLKAQLDAIALQRDTYNAMYDERLSKETEGTAKYNEILAERTAKETEFITAKITGEQEYNEAVKTYTADQKQLSLDLMQAKAGALSAGLGLAKELMSEDANMQTAIALAEAVMQTYVAANVALASSPPPLNFINMAGVIATGIANVIKIKKEADKLASETGSGSSASSVSGGISVGPSINVARSNVVDSNTQLKNAMNQANKPPKAYVVGNDIESQQSLDRKIYNNATLGGK